MIAFIVGHQYDKSGESSGMLIDIIGNIHFWLSTVLLVAIIMLPFYISKSSDFLFSNEIVINLIQKRYEYDIAKRKYYNKLDGVINCINSIAKFKKLYKLDKDFEVDNYADKKMKEIVDMYKIKYLDKNDIEEKKEKQDFKKNVNYNEKKLKTVEFVEIKDDENIELKKKNNSEIIKELVINFQKITGNNLNEDSDLRKINEKINVIIDDKNNIKFEENINQSSIHNQK